MNYTVEDLYFSFLKGRKTFLGVNWWKFGSFFKRVVGSSKEFSRLVGYENNFLRAGIEWLIMLENQNYINQSDIPYLRAKLKLFKEELTSRNGFLIAFAVLLALVISIQKTLEQVFPNIDANLWLYIPTSVFAILAVLERAYVLAHASYASQLDVLLECWGEQNS